MRAQLRLLDPPLVERIMDEALSVLERNGVTTPRVRLARLLSTQLYPSPQAQRSNQLQLVDLVGPIYLKGQRQRYYLFICRVAFDGAVHLKLGRSRQMEAVLTFLVNGPTPSTAR